MAFVPTPGGVSGSGPPSDLDLVIARGEVEEARRALQEGGYVESNRQGRPYKSDWAPRGASTTVRSLEVTHRDDPLTLDLHTTLDRNFFGVGTVSFGPLGDLSTRRHVLGTPGGGRGGMGFRILTQPVLAASLAAHASEGLLNLSMIRLVELVLVLRRDRARGELVWADLCSVLERADALRFTYPAFEMAERLVPGTLEPGFISRLAEAAPVRMRRVMTGLQPFSARPFGDVALEERFMWGRGPAEHLRRVLHMLWPASAGSLRTLGRLYANRLWRVFRGRVSLRASHGSAPVEPGPPPPAAPS